MYRIDNSTAATTIPVPGAVGPNPNGFFTDGVPGSVAATVVPADWLNATQEEIANAITASGQTLSKTNRTQLATAINTAGRLINVQTFTASGTYTPTPGMGSVIFEVQGGGAAGGGATGATGGNVSLGAPGTAGSYAKGRFTAASVGASQTVTVGAGGTGVSGAAGNNGGTSSVGALISAPGGVGGTTLTNQAAPTINGNGSFSPAPAGGNISSAVGTAGTPSLAVSSAIAVTGAGGGSQFGAGAYSTAINGAGVSAQNPGAGGAATVTNSSGGSTTGGAGYRGVVLAYEYS
jgi:hypothetical protein